MDTPHVDAALSLANNKYHDTTTFKKARSATFSKTMEAMRCATRYELQRREEKAAEEEAARRKRKRQQEINELYALIAALSQKLAASGYQNRGIEAELSLAKSQLFALLLMI